MEFEFDPEKSDINKRKHGIDFVEAQALWDDPDFIEIPVKASDEPRFLVIGRISEKHWSGIITYRGDKIRIYKGRPGFRPTLVSCFSPRIPSNLSARLRSRAYASRVPMW